ncbi:MAG: hypothetical protein EXR67_01585 [Dehalococcoidia bacterium]|nr:hypothetical protein [Dehalococcoidia bacterium]
MADSTRTSQEDHSSRSILVGPVVDPTFNKALGDLVALAKQGHKPTSQFFNPSDEWLFRRMRIFQEMSKAEQDRLVAEYKQIALEMKQANDAGKAAQRAGPDTVFRLHTGGRAFFSQLGVARRPDLTQYFVDGFTKNRDAISFSEANQALFSEILPFITKKMREHFAAGDTVIQSDRQVGDVPGRSFHARQLLFGDYYLQLPYLWRQLTFDLPDAGRAQPPHILEISIPKWLEDFGLPDNLVARIRQAGLTQLVFKAPTKGLSLHLGFDYAGEHKMGPLSIAMYQVKEAGGLAVQAALSGARIRALDGSMTNTALVTIGPSLHGKSTLTIMLELAGSELAKHLNLSPDPEEGVYPMNDDIVLLQRLQEPIEKVQGGRKVSISHSIDGTENSFYAVPAGLTHMDDPITYEVLRGTQSAPNTEETLENVPVNPQTGEPDFSQNPTRNMRMILSRKGLIARKGSKHLIEAMTAGQEHDSVHVPMGHINQVFWQAVMRQNTVIPPLRRVTIDQYVRVLMYGEAVQMGAAVGAIGRPYVEYFSDPFIIGLEDDNANLMHDILHELARGGMPQRYYVFNTGGLGADTNDQAAGAKYKKIPRELTLMLQEALLRGAVRFVYDPILRSHVAAAIVNKAGDVVVDLSQEWSPRHIYGDIDYIKRIVDLTQRRYYGRDASDKAGILRYTKVRDEVFDLEDIPAPRTERELAWLLSFYWHVDQSYNTIVELADHRSEGRKPSLVMLQELQQFYASAAKAGVRLSPEGKMALHALGLQAVGS